MRLREVIREGESCMFKNGIQQVIIVWIKQTREWFRSNILKTIPEFIGTAT